MRRSQQPVLTCLPAPAAPAHPRPQPSRPPAGPVAPARPGHPPIKPLPASPSLIRIPSARRRARPPVPSWPAPRTAAAAASRPSPASGPIPGQRPIMAELHPARRPTQMRRCLTSAEPRLRPREQLGRPCRRAPQRRSDGHPRRTAGQRPPSTATNSTSASTGSFNAVRRPETGRFPAAPPPRPPVSSRARRRRWRPRPSQATCRRRFEQRWQPSGRRRRRTPCPRPSRARTLRHWRLGPQERPTPPLTSSPLHQGLR